MQKKWIKNILTLFFLAVFVYAAANLFLIWQEYRQSDALYDAAQTEFLTAPELEQEFETRSQSPGLPSQSTLPICKG